MRSIGDGAGGDSYDRDVGRFPGSGSIIGSYVHIYTYVHAFMVIQDITNGFLTKFIDSRNN